MDISSVSMMLADLVEGCADCEVYGSTVFVGVDSDSVACNSIFLVLDEARVDPGCFSVADYDFSLVVKMCCIGDLSQLDDYDYALSVHETIKCLYDDVNMLWCCLSEASKSTLGDSMRLRVGGVERVGDSGGCVSYRIRLGVSSC